MILFYEREICFYRKKTTLLQGKVQLSVNRAFFKGIVSYDFCQQRIMILLFSSPLFHEIKASSASFEMYASGVIDILGS